MALPSQLPRSGMSVPRLTGGGRRRRARTARRSALLLLLLGGAAAGGWFMWGRDEHPSETLLGLGGDDPGGPAAEADAAGGDVAAWAGAGGSAPVTESRRRGDALAIRNERVLADRSGDGGGRPPGVERSSMFAATIGSEPPNPHRSPQAPEAPEAPEAPRAREAEQVVGQPAAPAAGRAAMTAMSRAQAALDQNRPVDARDLLNRALHAPGLRADEALVLRDRLTALSELLTFSPRIVPSDSTADVYVVQPGDALSAIPGREGFRVDYRLIQRLNRIGDPRSIRPGQKLKVLYGPFHAVVDKSEFRLDLYADQTDSAGNRLFIRSFDVGLGEYGSTPTGGFVVRSDSKLVNPRWVNPRTGEVFEADDPANPIGKRWIGLEGVDANTEVLSGYGIHGTVEPGSIGEERSMGCVRMLAEDVELMYELLVPRLSQVAIVP